MREYLYDSKNQPILEEKDQTSCFSIASALTNDGYFDNKAPMSVKDLITTEELTRFVPTAISLVVREALEPMLLLNQNLFMPIRMKAGQSIQIGSVGAIEAAEIAEGGEYPEREPQMGPGDMVAATVTKKGVRIQITDEAITDNNFDIIALFLRQAGYALGRLKERKAWMIINSMGKTLFDNKDPGSDCEYGVCTGRDISGAQNGAMTVNDIFDMYAYLWMRGFAPDTLIMHPMAWKVFAHDPMARELFIKGNTVASRQLPMGETAPGWGTSHGNLGLRTKATGAETTGASPWVSTLNPLGSTFHSNPDFLPSPVRVLVTPNAAYSATGATSGEPTTDIAMAQSNMCGLYIEREKLAVEEWNDPSRDMRNLKLRERYGHAVMEQGKGIGVARDVVVAPHFSFENTNSVSLNPLDNGTDGSPTF